MLLSRPWPEPMVATVRFLDVSAPALIVGSTQPMGSLDAGSGIDVARRSSGGSAVLVRPGEVLWVDLFVPCDDTLWHADVGRATHWLGETWALVLGDLGIRAGWHDGAFMPGLWSHLACFGGLAPGEVTVATRKVVGISQRRTRAGVQFQCAALLAWDPGALVALFAPNATEQQPAVNQLSAAAAPLPVRKSALEAAFVRRLAER